MASTVSQVRPIPLEASSTSEKMEFNSGDESVESPSKLDESSEELSAEEKATTKSADESEEKLSEAEIKTTKVGTKKRVKVSSDDLKSDLDANPAEQVKSEGHRRERKQVERFAIATPKATEKATVIPEGKGTKLGEIPYIADQINRQRAADLEYLHRFFFGKRGSSSEIKKHLRLFSGFDFDESSAEFQKKKAQALKWTPKVLKPICDTLGLQKKGVKEQVVDRILEFSLSPSDTGAKVKSKAKRKSSSSSSSTKRKSSSTKSASRTSSSSAKSAKKEATKKQKKSEESEQDEHDDDDEDVVVVQKKTKTVKSVESDDEPPRKRSREGPARQAAVRKSYKDESDSERDEEEDDQVEDEPPPKKTKAVIPKMKKKPTKPVVVSSDDEDGGSSEPHSDSDREDDDDQVKKTKSKAPIKASPSKSKSSSKAQSDSESEHCQKDDKKKPLKSIDKSSLPTDDELKKVVTGLMKTANLKKVTMKTLLQEVGDKFPGVDLSTRKSYIKEAVEEILEATT